MIKRSLALFFILFANTILLAHSIVPHYHHKSEICIVNFHSHLESDSQKHSEKTHEHKHDGKKDSENCILKGINVIPSNRLIIEPKNSDWIDNNHHFNIFLSSLLNSELGSSEFQLNLKRIIQFTTSYHSYYIVTSLGLRAPPSV